MAELTENRKQFEEIQKELAKMRTERVVHPNMVPQPAIPGRELPTQTMVTPAQVQVQTEAASSSGSGLYTGEGHTTGKPNFGATRGSPDDDEPPDGDGGWIIAEEDRDEEKSKKAKPNMGEMAQKALDEADA